MAFLTWGLGDRELTPEERRLVLRSMAVIAIPLALITAFALILGALVFKGQLDGQVKRNREAIQRADEAIVANKMLARQVSKESKERASAIAQAVFHECVENELQDSVLVNQVLRPTIQGLRQSPNQTSQLQAYIDSLSQAVLAREPPNEKDCVLPGQNK